MPAGLESVADAAKRLDVHPSRVRALIYAGQLKADKVGRAWLVHTDSLDRRKHSEARPGRPLSPRNAWALLCMVEGSEAEWAGDSSVRSRLRARLRRDGLQVLAARLRRRARVEVFRAHPSALRRLAADPDLVPSGISSASDHGLDVAAADEVEGYVSPHDLDRLIGDYGLMRRDDGANVTLHVLPDHAGLPGLADLRQCMGAVVSALDLVESQDPRSRRAGMEYLASLDEAAGRQPDAS